MIIKKIGSWIYDNVFYHGPHKYYDHTLFITVFCLMAFGLVMVYSATNYSDASTYSDAYHSLKSQAMVAAGSIVLALIISKMDYHFIVRCYMPVVVLTMILCVYVLFKGRATNGAVRWINIGGFSFQPSEMAKPSLILWLSYYLTEHYPSKQKILELMQKRNDKIQRKRKSREKRRALAERLREKGVHRLIIVGLLLLMIAFVAAVINALRVLIQTRTLKKGLLVAGIILVVYAISSEIIWLIRHKKSAFKLKCRLEYGLGALLITLILVAPVITENLSTGIIIAGIGCCMLYIATKNFIILPASFGCMIIAVVAAWHTGALQQVLAEYQIERIQIWLDLENTSADGAYQVLQGLYAIGSGGFIGKGLGASIQKLGFLPEAQNDMIFNVICEELGLFGALFVIAIFVFLLFRMLILADRAPDRQGSFIISGVMIHIGLQFVMNIAVATNSMPNTGVTLPFISYGGSALICLFIEIGLVLSVTNQITD